MNVYQFNALLAYPDNCGCSSLRNITRGGSIKTHKIKLRLPCIIIIFKLRI
jgi:hypothetical protein